MSAAGTVETIALALASSLAPLQRRLSAEEVDGYFASLGLQFPTSVTAHSNLNNALEGARIAASQLAPPAASLSQAIEDGNLAGILAEGAATLSKLGDMFSKLHVIGVEMGTLANSFPGIPPSEISAFAAGLPRAIMERAIVEHFELLAPEVANALVIVGIIDRHMESGDPVDAAKVPFEVKRLKLNRLTELLRDPTAYLQNLYGWGSSTFDGQFFFGQLYEFAAHSGMAALLIPAADPGGFPSLDLLFLELGVDNTTNPRSLRFELRIPSQENFRFHIPLESPGWRLEMASDGKFDVGLTAQILPPTSLTLTPPSGSLTGGWRAQLSKTPIAPNSHLLIVGQAGGTRLEATSISLLAKAEVQWDAAAGVGRAEPTLEFTIHGGRFVLSLDEAGGPLAAFIAKNGTLATLDLGIGWSRGRIYLVGSAELRATFPVEISLGPVEVHALSVGLVPGPGGDIPVEILSNLSATLGPLTILVEGIGLRTAFDFPSDGHGSLGPLNVNLNFRFPSGIGVALDAGIVKGGGFLAELPPGSGRFAGALQVKILALGVGAFGIFERTAAGNISLVVVVGARFPGIQLGFGFMITGLGGLVGVNRRADVDTLFARLSSGAAGNVLFCDDPVRNAPALFTDLAAFFPSADGIFLVGPTLQLSWLYIVRFDLGLIIELPGPSKVIVVGTARFEIPGLGSTVPLVKIRVDILGGVDATIALIFFDASLVDSSVLGVFVLTGDSAFRFSYGSNSYILFSIGGFNPAFNPEPIKIRHLARASAGYSINVGIKIWMRQEFYFAFTPNTLQLGARVEAGLEIGPVGAHGFFSFDALVQFRPFYFEFNISAGFDIEFEGESLCHVHIDGKGSGPGPLVISASVSFKILIVRFRFSRTFQLGSGNGDVPRVDVNVLEELLKQVPLIENVHAEDEERSVILKKSAVPGIALVSPSSKIFWTQRLAPFNVRLERFSGTPLARQFKINLSPSMPTSDATEAFALGSYANVSDSEALNNNGFHREKAGIQLKTNVSKGGEQRSKTIKISVKRVPELETLFLNASLWHLGAVMFAALASPSGPAKVAASPAIVKVHEEVWDVHDSSGNVVAVQVSALQAFQEARAAGGFSAPAVGKTLNLAGL